MPDWTKSMIQSFEYWVVDPLTWGDLYKLDTIRSSSVSRDSESETLETASFEIDNIEEDSAIERYIRIYLVTIQNRVTERHCLGTFLAQTPLFNYDGKVSGNSLDAYSPLLEMKDISVPFGYYLERDSDILDNAYYLAEEHSRAPVIGSSGNALNKTLISHFTSTQEDSWLSYLSALLGQAEYHFDLDDYSRILLVPSKSLSSMQSKWTFDSGNSSILYPETTKQCDLYGLPNVIEVIYSSNDKYYYSKVVNDDPDSPVSTVSRGREVWKRITDPSVTGNPSQEEFDEYANELLENMSTLTYVITFKHGYCPVRIGDCVTIDYPEAGLDHVRAVITKQNISCVPGTPVDTTAVYTKKLWGE